MAKLVLFLQIDVQTRENLSPQALWSLNICNIYHLYYFCSQNNNKNNRNMERLFFFVIAVALAFGVGCLGRNRKIGFGWAFGISLINVVIGLIVVLCSKKKTPNELEKKN